MTVKKYKKFWAQRLPSSVTRDSAFTLIELLVVVAIIAILSGMLLPVLSKAKGAAQKVKCISQLGQLNLASQLYRDDSNGALPARTDGMTALGGRVPASWPGTLFPYFQSTNTLRCPADKANALTGIQPHPVDRVVRSYLFNGWNDHFLARMKRDYKLSALIGRSMHEQAIQEPTQTVLFGEKKDNSPALYMDFLEGFGNDIQEVEHGRHAPSKTQRSKGSSVFGFADGSVRSIKFGGSFKPLNQWATESIWRTNTAIFLIKD